MTRIEQQVHPSNLESGPFESHKHKTEESGFAGEKHTEFKTYRRHTANFSVTVSYCKTIHEDATHGKLMCCMYVLYCMTWVLFRSHSNWKSSKHTCESSVTECCCQNRIVCEGTILRTQRTDNRILQLCAVCECGLTFLKAVWHLWRTFYIHGTFPAQKILYSGKRFFRLFFGIRFFMESNDASMASFTVKITFGTFIYKSVWG